MTVGKCKTRKTRFWDERFNLWRSANPAQFCSAEVFPIDLSDALKKLPDVKRKDVEPDTCAGVRWVTCSSAQKKYPNLDFELKITCSPWPKSPFKLITFLKQSFLYTRLCFSFSPLQQKVSNVRKTEETRKFSPASDPIIIPTFLLMFFPLFIKK